MDTLIAYLKDGGAPDDPIRKELAKILRDSPDMAADIFARAVGSTVNSTSIDTKSKMRQFLGYIERLFSYLLDDRNVGWAAVRDIMPKFANALPMTLRVMMPMSTADPDPNKHCLPTIRALSLDFRARATAGSVRSGDMTERGLAAFVIDLLNNIDEKKTLLEMVQKDVEPVTPAMDARLQEIASRPVIRRDRMYSSSFILKTATKETRAVVPALVIEPNEALRYTFKIGLVTEGFTVIEASNGADAGGIIDDAQPKVVIMELMLTGATGLALLGKLRSKRPIIPVVAKSADERLALEFDVKTYPAITYLKKPVSPDHVVQAIRSLRAKFNF
jgi:CheY-like chemotaxis protein